MNDFWQDRNWRINRILWRFNHRGAFGKKTFPYEDLDTEIKGRVNECFAFPNGEVPLIVYFDSSENWTCLTSDRIIGKKTEKNFSIALDKITRVSPIFDPSYIDSNGNFIKLKDREILKVHENEEVWNVPIEGPMKSGPMLGLWNTMLLVMNMG